MMSENKMEQVNSMNDGRFTSVEQPNNAQFAGIENLNVGLFTPVNDAKSYKITDVNALQGYANGIVVRLPDFAEGQPLIAKIKRPSMLALAKSGKIPNSLLNAAGTLFAEGGSGLDVDNPNMLKEMYEVCKVICEASLIQPTLAEIESAGLELTDEQIMVIFNYSQVGVKALENFREE